MTFQMHGISARSSRAHRVVAPFSGREGFIRLDRNEDPVGWPADLIAEFSGSITPEMLAAYPDPLPLCSKIANWLGRETNEILVTNGSTEGLRLLYETFADEGTTTVRMDPSYSLYDLYESVAGSKNVVTSYSLDLRAPVGALIDEIRNHHPSLVTIANPDQPSGSALGIDDLAGIARITDEVGATLAIDEAYHLFGAESALRLLDQHANLVIVRTFSKAFGLAGLRLGYLVARPEVIDKIKRLEPAVPPSSVSLHGGVWVLDHLDFALERVADAIRGRQYLAKRLEQAGSPAFPSWGNFLLVPARTDSHARKIVSGSRDQGFLVKGPVTIQDMTPCVRITIGPLGLMEEYWTACGDLYVHTQSA